MPIEVSVEPPLTANPLTWVMALVWGIRRWAVEWQTKRFRDRMCEVFAALERQENAAVGVIRINAATYSYIRGIDEFVPMTRAEYLRQGLVGHLWGAEVRADASVRPFRVRLEEGRR